jgi:hypothetical protein
MKPFFPIFTIVFSVFLACACSSTKHTSQQSNFSQRPEWVNSKPITSFYFIGIGGASKRLYSEYMEVARRSALNDLASEISVTVTSNTSFYQSEMDRQQREDFQSMIRLKVNQQIQDFEVVDQWEDNEYYWIYYRLSKDQYRRHLEEKRNRVYTQAQAHFERAAGMEEQGQVIGAIKDYIKSLISLQEYLTDQGRVNFRGNSIVLAQEAKSRAVRMLNNIQISPSQPNINYKLIAREINTPINVFYGNQRSMVIAAPLTASFVTGKGTTNIPALTNANGSSHLNIRGIQPRPALQIVSVRLNMERILDEAEAEAGMELKAIRPFFVSPESQINISPQQPIFFLESRELNLGNLMHGNTISNHLRTRLQNDGFIFATEKNKADIILKINADTSKGGEMSGLFTTTLNLNLLVEHLETGRELYRLRKDDIKGVHNSYERSGERAYANATQGLDQAITEMLNQIF